jgi:hypothetical protein
LAGWLAYQKGNLDKLELGCFFLSYLPSDNGARQQEKQKILPLFSWNCILNTKA